MMPRLPTAETPTCMHAMAKCGNRARSVSRILWTTIGFAGYRETKHQSCFAARPVPFATSTEPARTGMVRIRIATLTNTVSTFSQMESNRGREICFHFPRCSATRERLCPLPAHRTFEFEWRLHRIPMRKSLNQSETKVTALE
jgi:hypothetical protein